MLFTRNITFELKFQDFEGPYTYILFLHFSDTERIQPATSSLSISGAKDGSSPESPAPSLPPKPAFSYSNVSLKTKESPHRQSTEILGIRSTNIPPPAQPPPPLPIHHKLSLKQQIEKEL